MAFYGTSFVFDGIPCEDFGLMLYNIGDSSQGGGTFASTPTIQEETRPTGWRPFFFGTKFENKLEFELVFGVNQKRLDEQKHLDRYEVNAIASWLTGHEQYKELSIVQEDMEHLHYKCMITGLEIVEYGLLPWGFKATVTCDSPYAYLAPCVYSYAINGEKNISFLNKSSYNGYYYPVIEFEKNSGNALVIKNQTDGGRIFELTRIPDTVTSIRIDCDAGVITSNTSTNLYEHCNFNFPRLKRGYNTLNITGNGTLKITCEFPINAGG